jgi:hypothetical protein
MKTALIILQILFLFVVACDHGLDPETDKEKPGIEGIVTVLEPWPDTLGVREVYIIVFREIPVDSASAVEQFFSGGVSFAGPFQPGGQVYPFSIDMDPGVYRFVSCVGLRGESLFSLTSWLVLGLYSSPGAPVQPLPVTVNAGERSREIDINVRFSALPPQPF